MPCVLPHAAVVLLLENKHESLVRDAGIPIEIHGTRRTWAAPFPCVLDRRSFTDHPQGLRRYVSEICPQKEGSEEDVEVANLQSHQIRRLLCHKQESGTVDLIVSSLHIANQMVEDGIPLHCQCPRVVFIEIYKDIHSFSAFSHRITCDQTRLNNHPVMKYYTRGRGWVIKIFVAAYVNAMRFAAFFCKNSL